MSMKAKAKNAKPPKPGKDDYETVETPIKFKGVVSGKPSGKGISIDPEAIARAEGALERLSVSFNLWMDEELDALREAYEAARSEAFTDPGRERLYRVAHDLRGQGATLGYPLVGSVAGSLSEMLQAIPEEKDVPEALVESHVQSVIAIVREGAKGDDNETAVTLANSLREVSESWLESKGYPEEPPSDDEEDEPESSAA